MDANVGLIRRIAVASGTMPNVAGMRRERPSGLRTVLKVSGFTEAELPCAAFSALRRIKAASRIPPARCCFITNASVECFHHHIRGHYRFTLRLNAGFCHPCRPPRNMCAGCSREMTTTEGARSSLADPISSHGDSSAVSSTSTRAKNTCYARRR